MMSNDSVLGLGVGLARATISQNVRCTVTLAALAALAVAVVGCASPAPNGSQGSGGAAAAGGNGATGGGGGGRGGGGAGADSGAFAGGVRVHLEPLFSGAQVISFGLPVPAGRLPDAHTLRISMGGAPVAANVKTLLSEHDASGAAVGVRALLVQLPAGILTGGGAGSDVDVAWNGAGSAPSEGTTVAYGSAGVSAASPEIVDTTVRTIDASGGANRLVDGPHTPQTLFAGREPRVLATFPDGYLAATAILGRQATASDVTSGDLAGLGFLSDALRSFGASAMYADGYASNPDGVVDPLANFEGWLYDRCATFLTFYTHTGDARFLRHAYRSCSYYAGSIALTGPDAGTFTGKSPADTKYSHLRGLYAYYALTGDDGALAAGTAIARMWAADTLFVAPYRAGHLRGTDKLWTERLLGTSLEGLYYGHRLTGEVGFLTAFREMLDTAYRHVTGDAAALAAINPGVGPFPPQNCFIHSALQHAEGNADQPWCSTWMSELTIDALLSYQQQTGDDRVDEMFVRLARFLRDVGSQYMTNDVLGDSFLAPSVCYDQQADPVRRLVPLYGAGLDAAGARHDYGNADDDEHCTDATALTSAAIRALAHQGKLDANPVPPFATEGESFIALHHELAACARRSFDVASRPRRDPAAWSSAQLAGGVADPASFIAANLIGYPKYPSSPQRKLSWWFNMSMLQIRLLADAGVTIPALAPGRLQPAGCP